MCMRHRCFLRDCQDCNRKGAGKGTNMDRDKFLEPETRCGYYISEEQKKLWSLEMETYEKLAEVCNKHGLKFFVSCGTLLGAVRHKGFIPWDLDMDVCMPRTDYDKLIYIAADEFRDPFELQTTDAEHDFFVGFGKLRNSKGTMFFKGDAGKQCNHGVWVDIFPLDNVSDNETEWLKQSKHVQRYHYLCHAHVYGKVFYRHYEDKVWEWNLAKSWAAFLCRVKSFAWLNQKFLDAVQQYNSQDTKRTGMISLGAAPEKKYNKNYYSIYKEDYEELVYLDFEYLKVPAPKGWHRYLETTYGDYMELPDASRRKAKYLENVIDPYTPYQQFDFSAYTDIFEYGRGKDFLLFGGGHACDMFIAMYRKKCNFVAIYDNNKEKWGTAFKGIPIRCPDDLKKDMGGNSLIVITSSYDREISQQLRKMGIFEYRHYVFGRYY